MKDYLEILKNSCIMYVLNKLKEKCMIRKWENVIFKELYISKIRSFYSNLNSNSYIHNINFKDKIVNGTIKVNDIGKLSVYDIYPENWTELLDKKIKRDKLKYEMKPKR